MPNEQKNTEIAPATRQKQPAIKKKRRDIAGLGGLKKKFCLRDHSSSRRFTRLTLGAKILLQSSIIKLNIIAGGRR